MKYFVKIALFLGFMVLGTACSTTSTLPTMEGGVCNNPKCKCPKPCPCGAGCQCGMNGNSEAMNGQE